MTVRLVYDGIHVLIFNLRDFRHHTLVLLQTKTAP